MSTKRQPKTVLCAHTPDAIYVRDKNLVEELVGKVSFTQMLFFDIMGRMPSDQETAIVDAVMVTLMEHGLGPSAVAARMVYSSAPEALQGGVAAGLLGAGSMVLGTMENAAELLERICSDPAGVEAAARREAEAYRAEGKPLPGFGHPHHKPDDPRTPKLFEVAESNGVTGNYISALKELSKAVKEVYGRHLTINATGAVAALLCEIGIPKNIMRGFAIITRAAGLVAHIREEQHDPAMWVMLRAAEESIPYSGDVPQEGHQ
jgi:citrate synthase